MYNIPIYILFVFGILISCDKSSNSNAGTCTKTTLLNNIWNLDEIEIVQPPDGSPVTSWKYILSKFGPTNTLGNGAFTLELINKLGYSEWIINDAEIYDPLIKSICCPKYIGPIYRYRGRFSGGSSSQIKFTYIDDQNKIFESELSGFIIKDCKLTITLNLKNNEIWKFSFS